MVWDRLEPFTMLTMCNDFLPDSLEGKPTYIQHHPLHKPHHQCCLEGVVCGSLLRWCIRNRREQQEPAGTHSVCVCVCVYGRPPAGQVKTQNQWTSIVRTRTERMFASAGKSGHIDYGWAVMVRNPAGASGSRMKKTVPWRVSGRELSERVSGNRRSTLSYAHWKHQAASAQTNPDRLLNRRGK